MNLPDRVRTSCKEVAGRARFVRLDQEAIEAYAAALAWEAPIVSPQDPAFHYQGEPEDTAGFFLVLGSINFGSGYFPYLKKRSGMSGYFTIASSLSDRFRREGPLGAEVLSRIRTEEVAEIFGQEKSSGGGVGAHETLHGRIERARAACPGTLWRTL